MDNAPEKPLHIIRDPMRVQREGTLSKISERDRELVVKLGTGNIGR